MGSFGGIEIIYSWNWEINGIVCLISTVYLLIY